MKGTAINIVLSQIDEGPQMMFVEIETDGGKAITIGELRNEGEYSYLRITSEDILNHLET